MIVSRRYQFIFIANLRTASTSIENSLEPYSDIHVKTTQCGKHMSMNEVDGLILQKWPKKFLGDTGKLFRFGVMRTPASYVQSIYKFHTKNAFRGQPHYTGDQTFEGFLNEAVLQGKRWQLRDQYQMFVDAHDLPAVDFILRFENLKDDFGRAMKHLGIRASLRHKNKSPWALRGKGMRDHTKRIIEEAYARDYEFYESYVGKLGLR